jgi:hypothetical protein
MHSPPKSLVSRTIAAACIAWLVGIACLFVSSFVLSECEKKSNELNDPILQLPFIGLAVAFVVFPACVGLGLPLFIRLPKTSLLWWPVFATATGVILGPVAMFFVLIVLSSPHVDWIDSRNSFHQSMMVASTIVSDWINWQDTFNQSMMVTSAMVGGSFAYVSAILHGREGRRPPVPRSASA